MVEGLNTHQFRETVYIPLKHNPYFKSQPGEVSNSVQMVCRDDNIEFRLFRNPDFSDQRQFYNPDTEVIGLDFGLTPLLATNEGDLLSREFKDRLEDFDERITKLARYRQEHGLDVSSQRYKRLIESLRGYIKSEINRVFNRLIESKKPSHLVVEDLNLQHPDLSRSLNRLISFCGRSEIQEKLDKLEEEYGITYEEVPSPYSSVACSSCKYPDPSNRNEDRFECRFCGLECHADVNAARNLVSRRSWDDKVSEPLTKRGILHRQLRLHVERQTKTLFQGVSSGSGINGDAADLLLENRYIDDSLKEEVISKWNDHASVVSELASST